MKKYIKCVGRVTKDGKIKMKCTVCKEFTAEQYELICEACKTLHESRRPIFGLIANPIERV